MKLMLETYDERHRTERLLPREAARPISNGAYRLVLDRLGGDRAVCFTSWGFCGRAVPPWNTPLSNRTAVMHVACTVCPVYGHTPTDSRDVLVFSIGISVELRMKSVFFQYLTEHFWDISYRSRKSTPLKATFRNEPRPTGPTMLT